METSRLVASTILDVSSELVLSIVDDSVLSSSVDVGVWDGKDSVTDNFSVLDSLVDVEASLVDVVELGNSSVMGPSVGVSDKFVKAVGLELSVGASLSDSMSVEVETSEVELVKDPSFETVASEVGDSPLISSKELTELEVDDSEVVSSPVDEVSEVVVALSTDDSVGSEVWLLEVEDEMSEILVDVRSSVVDTSSVEISIDVDPPVVDDSVVGICSDDVSIGADESVGDGSVLDGPVLDEVVGSVVSEDDVSAVELSDDSSVLDEATELDRVCSELDESDKGRVSIEDGSKLDLSEADEVLIVSSVDVVGANAEEVDSEEVESENDSPAVEEVEVSSELEVSVVEEMEAGVVPKSSDEVDNKLELERNSSEKVLNESEVVLRGEKNVMLVLEVVSSSLDVIPGDEVNVVLRSPELPNVDRIRLVGEIVVVRLETTNPGQSRTVTGQHGTICNYQGEVRTRSHGQKDFRTVSGYWSQEIRI